MLCKSTNMALVQYNLIRRKFSPVLPLPVKFGKIEYSPYFPLFLSKTAAPRNLSGIRIRHNPAVHNKLVFHALQQRGNAVCVHTQRENIRNTLSVRSVHGNSFLFSALIKTQLARNCFRTPVINLNFIFTYLFCSRLGYMFYFPATCLNVIPIYHEYKLLSQIVNSYHLL